MEKLPFTIVHYSGKDPRTTTGGVESFARNLSLFFERVELWTPGQRDLGLALREQWPVICDNQRVLDWPADFPVIGFQHGVAAVKARATGKWSHRRLARKQKRAAARPNTLWVACAEWIAATFAQLHGNGARHVVYHAVDTDRFDGRLENEGSRLVLHDARKKHKGRDLIRPLQKACPEWHFEPLACRPEQVPDRLRQARAFVHLSRYEGNSIVCNEAMAMDLPCLVTKVGLFLDAGRPQSVHLVDPGHAFGDPEYLVREVGEFLESLDIRTFNPRAWTLSHATRRQSIDRWRAVMLDFQARFGWKLGLAPR